MGATQSYLSPEAAVTAIVVAGAIGIGYTQFGQVESKPDSASPSNQTSTPVPAQPKKNKKKKKGGAAPAAATGQPDVPVSDDGAVSSTNQKPAALPNVIPGQFDASSPPPVDHTAAPASKPKKAKKKKAKAAGTGAGAATKLPAAATPASSDSESSSKPPQPEKKDQLASSSSSSKLTRPLQQSTISIDTDDSWTRVEPRRRQPAPLTTPAIASTPADQLTTSDAGITSSHRHLFTRDRPHRRRTFSTPVT
ncbi:hypothetical protein BDQ17DRAFT_1435581 [Cyathus striatus]|nr:hypothetical protein BDQ17DRAFT_1435581 [Cyathus striatus]